MSCEAETNRALADLINHCARLLEMGEPPAEIPTTFACPLVAGPTAALAAGARWFVCAWQADQWPREPGLAVLWRTKEELCVLGVMADSEVSTKAVGKNDQTWAKGDVLEIFLQPADSEQYYELHLAPNLATLELAIPSIADFRSGKHPFETLFADLGLRGESGRLDGSGVAGWWGLMRIPRAKVGLADRRDGQAGRVGICRYNYNQAWGEKPECSATPPFMKFNYHQPECWQELLFTGTR